MKQGVRFWVVLGAVNVLTAGALLIVALACVEGYLRLTIPSSSGGSIFQPTLATRRYKVMKPNFRIVAWGSELRTNDLGFRDNKGSVSPKAPQGFRVLVLGDSFTVAAGVDFDNIYTTLLDKHLKQRNPNAQVINLAVGGYNIIQYDLVLREVGLALEPDAIIVGVFPFNDLENDTYRANIEDAEGRSRPRPRAWFRELYVYRAFLGRIEARLMNWFQLAGSMVPLAGRDGAIPSDAVENLAALERLLATASAHNIPAIVALLPNTDEPALQRDSFAPFLSQCEAHGWYCVNLLDDFVAAGDNLSSMRINLLDPHPNQFYNARVAQFMSGHVARLLKAFSDTGGAPPGAVPVAIR